MGQKVEYSEPIFLVLNTISNNKKKKMKKNQGLAPSFFMPKKDRLSYFQKTGSIKK